MSSRKRRKVANDSKNEFLPDKPSDEGADFGSLEFQELLDEEVCSFSFRDEIVIYTAVLRRLLKTSLSLSTAHPS